MNKPQDCKYFAVCSASLCPLDENLHKRTWYPSEPICRCRCFQSLLWLRKQKRIAKVTDENAGYFDHEMLNRNFRVSKGLKGLNPDKEENPQKQRWLAGHKNNPKRQVSDEQIERLKKHHVT